MLYSQSPPLAKDDADLEDLSQEFAREPQFGRRPAPAPTHAAPRRPSLGRRMFRAVSRFVILVAIGVGATLGWQAYGDVAKQMLVERAPEQAWLLSYLPATSRPAVAVAATAPVPAPAPVAAPAGPAVDLEPLTSNLDRMRRSVEQLALAQEQMARSIAALHAADEEIKQKISSPPAAAAQPAAAVPLAKPALARAQAPAASAARTSSAPRPLAIAPSR